MEVKVYFLDILMGAPLRMMRDEVAFVSRVLHFAYFWMHGRGNDEDKYIIVDVWQLPQREWNGTQARRD